MIPTYKIYIGSLTIDSTQINANGLPIDILVDLRLNMINTARIVLHFPSGNSIVPGDTVEIELGVDGTQKVFSGIVREIKRGIQSHTVYCQSSLAALVTNRLNKLYEKQKAGDIVNDLAQTAGVSTGIVEDGFEFPVYVSGDDRSMFDHILDLAQRNGFDCYADVDDKLIFAKYSNTTTHSFQFGVNVLELNLDEEPIPVSAVEVYGESPSSLGQGADAYSWLTKQEVKGSAGTTSGITLRLSDPTLKDLDAAGSVAQSILDQRSKAKSGILKALGNSEARLGDAVQISDMPDSSVNGTYKISGMKHLLSKTKGFTTTVYWMEA